MPVPALAGVLTENETHMGRFPKALVMTLLIMEITAIVALTTVWALLSELHASQTIINAGLGIAAVGLCLLAVVIFRRAQATESRLAGKPEDELADAAVLLRGTKSELPGPNAIGPAAGPNLPGALHLVRGQPCIHRVE